MIFFKLIRRIISGLVLLALVIPSYAAIQVWSAAHNQLLRKADVIVVLGAAQLDGRPSEVLAARLIEAKRIYDAGLAPLIITVGAGAPGDRTTEAASSRRWLITHAIKPSHVIALELGRDTLGSTQAYAKKMKSLSIKSVIISTDPFHCRRAMTMANDLGLVSSCSSAKTGPNSRNKSGIHYLFREMGAYLAYITMGRYGIYISDRLPVAMGLK